MAFIHVKKVIKDFKYKIKNIRTNKKLTIHSTWREVASLGNFAFFVTTFFPRDSVQLGDIFSITPRFDGQFSFIQVKYKAEKVPFLSAQNPDDHRKLKKVYSLLKVKLLDNLEAVYEINKLFNSKRREKKDVNIK